MLRNVLILPISKLTWDPRELYWKVWFQDQIKHVSFFHYSMKIGRKILGARSLREPIVNVFWRRNGISLQHLKSFWKWLWGIKMSRKIVCFRWWLVHRAIPVHVWKKGNVDNMCTFCMDLIEIVKHCLWSCGFAMEIWKRIITLLLLVYSLAM